ncbi:MAG: DUF4870 domain-containing protein [Acidobacteria bacterium]|nr:DUF4870 domain-containing protein [Acidobacteriota bacterium]
MQNSPGGKTALGLDANVGALLCYLPVCAINLIYSIIVLVTEKDNKFVRFCAFQSLLLMVALIVLWVGVIIISVVLAFVSSTLSMLFSLVVWLFVLAFIGLAIFLCIKAYGMQKVKLPIIGDLAEKWA